MRKVNNTDKDTLDILKAIRKQNREEEIKAYGKPINLSHVEQSKKVYTRKVKHKTQLS